MNFTEKLTWIIISILTIFDWILKHSESISYWSLLVKPLTSINLLEIFIFIWVVFLSYKFINRKPLWKRAKNFLKNWYRFKYLLENYNNSVSRYESNKKKQSDPFTHKEYDSTMDFQLEQSIKKMKYEYFDIRDQLEIDFNFFISKIKEIQSKTHRQHNDLSIRNFEHCFLVRNIEDWENQIKREIPRELDCFDYLLISLKEECNK